ncbi:leucine-rich repeat-containing protein 55-like [Erpetoichthys calabaricus]|uniref:Leucine rich repeat containing 55 n=1 Tax=Erpetoichthys calabaricus TaxID=27687 RepID=A0A8C4SA54_ERPCA|nr:leucine-rich repeat-containing protein 55-like [Erpetoichthys calabaricus]
MLSFKHLEKFCSYPSCCYPFISLSHSVSPSSPLFFSLSPPLPPRAPFNLPSFFLSAILLLFLCLVVAPSSFSAALGSNSGKCPPLCTCTMNLTSVDCSNQQLFSPPPLLPRGIRNLSLAHNSIEMMPSGYLSCQPELVWLDLSNNSIMTLPHGMFSSQAKLQFLDLSRNNLTSLPASLLHPAQRLTFLRLARNPWLTELVVDQFAGLALLQELDVGHCGLRVLSVQVLDGLVGLSSLQLEGNPWVCGCAVEPLLNWVRNKIHRCSAGPTLTAECHSPPELEGIPLFSLTEESFRACRFALSLDDYLFIAFVGFVVSIASVATNFLLGITANCCHRWSKATDSEEI